MSFQFGREISLTDETVRCRVIMLDKKTIKGVGQQNFNDETEVKSALPCTQSLIRSELILKLSR